MKHGFYTDSLAYIADEFEKQAEDIIQQLQQLSPSSDDFVCNFRFVFLQKSNIYIYIYIYIYTYIGSLQVNFHMEQCSIC